jgi:hypothetical protein
MYAKLSSTRIPLTALPSEIRRPGVAMMRPTRSGGLWIDERVGKGLGAGASVPKGQEASARAF